MNLALIPAAGHSQRMGRPKLGLLFGQHTILEQVVGTLIDAGIDKVLVVIGPHVPELVPLAVRAGAETLLLPDSTSDMRETIEAGLTWLEAHWQPATDDAFLLVPADHPALNADVIRALQAANDDGIVIPTYRGQRGHPTRIGWKHVTGIRVLPRELGINAYLRQHPEAVRELPVFSECILWDLDTPEDYERLLQSSKAGSFGYGP